MWAVKAKSGLTALNKAGLLLLLSRRTSEEIFSTFFLLSLHLRPSAGFTKVLGHGDFYLFFYFFLKFGLSLNQNLTTVKKIHWATNKNNVRISQTVARRTMKQDKGAGDFLSLTNCLPDTARKSDVTTLRVLCCNSDQVLWLKRLLIGIPPVNIYLPIC